MFPELIQAWWKLNHAIWSGVEDAINEAREAMDFLLDELDVVMDFGNDE